MTSIQSTLLLLISAFAFSCNDQINTKKENIGDSTEKPAAADTMPVNELPVDTGVAQVDPPETVQPAIRLGRHDFTLHWISWDRPGKVNIEAAKDGWHPVKGSQRDSRGNFVTIEGELMVISPLELRFRGNIQSKVETVNNGDTCTRTGEKQFLSTRNRKYWRLQEMDNCEGNRVVDYVDIYF